MNSIRSSLLHEMEHIVQNQNRFSPGGTMDQFMTIDREMTQTFLNDMWRNAIKTGDPAKKDEVLRLKQDLDSQLKEAFQRYENLPGEQEARLVQQFSDLSLPELSGKIERMLAAGVDTQTALTKPVVKATPSILPILKPDLP